MGGAPRWILLVALAACAPGTAVPAPSTSPSTVPEPPSSTVPTTAAPATTTSTLPEPVVPVEPLPDPSPPPAGAPAPEGSEGVAVAALGGALVSAEPGGSAFVRAREGLVFGVDGRSGEWLRVRTPCDTRAWVHETEVGFVPRSEPGPVGAGFRLDRAVVVLDAGHGGPNIGAVGPQGLVEKEVNLDIARRIRDLLGEPRTVHWDSGVVLPGREIPAVGRVWMTRTEGPPGADYEAGLLFRAELANRAGSHAFVSIHNNADPDGPFEGPGSEVFYSVKDQQSRRLAGIMIEEFRRSFAVFHADWVGDTDAGAKYRVRDDGQTDYYGILRRASVPVVLAEGAFITNPHEEALLATPEFRQAYAEAVYRTLVRFLTTDDPGSGFTEPYPRTVPAGRGDPSPRCSLPEQP